MYGYNVFYFLCLDRWEYQTESELEGSSHWGLIGTYSGAGNVQKLGSLKNESELTIQYLEDNLWVRRGSRAVFIDFSVYNANINLFCVIRYMSCVVWNRCKQTHHFFSYCKKHCN